MRTKLPTVNTISLRKENDDNDNGNNRDSINEGKYLLNSFDN